MMPPSRRRRGERLGREDARILRLESPTVAGHTLKVTVLERGAGAPRLDLSALRSHVADRLPRLPRLTQRVEIPSGVFGAPAWVDDEAFDIQAHVRSSVVAAGGSDALRSLVGRIMSERLDRRRPLWTLDLVDGLADDRVALVLKLHHGMADGTGAVRIASALLWDGADAPAAAPRAAARSSAAVMSGRRRWRELLRESRCSPTAVERELSPRAARSAFARRVGRRRAVAWAAFPLADARTIERAVGSGVTVNDVVLSAAAGGLRRWLGTHGDTPAGLRVKVPVSMHGAADAAGDIANRDSCFFVDLPLTEPDPVRRLLQISAECAQRKHLGDAEALDVFFRDVAHVSRAAGRVAVRWSMSPRVFTLNVSNVRGPAGPLSVCGQPVAAVYSIAEVADWHAVRMSAFSAGGVLTLGICVDPQVVDDADLIADGVEDAVSELLARAG